MLLNRGIVYKLITVITSICLVVTSFNINAFAEGVSSTTQYYSTSPYQQAEIVLEDGVKYLVSQTNVDGDSFYKSLDETDYEIKVFTVLKESAERDKYSEWELRDKKYLVVKEKPLNPPEGTSEEETIVLWDDYVSDPLSYGKLGKAKLLDMYDNRAFQSVVEDKYEFIKYTGRLRQTIENEEREVLYTKLTKVWDYTEYDFPYDPPRYNTYTKTVDGVSESYEEEIFEHRKPKDDAEAAKYGIKPEWTPSRPWMADTSDEAYWFNDPCVTNVKLGDLMGELDKDGANRWEVPFVFTLCTLAYIGAHNFAYWDVDASNFKDPGYHSIDNYYLSDLQLQKILNAYNYKFDWHFTYEPWSEYENFLNLFHVEEWEKMEDLAPIEVRYEDMEKYSFLVEKAEIGVEVPEVPDTIGTEAYIEKIPQNAPKSISNIFTFVDYIYEDVNPEEDGDYGRQICTGRDRYINGAAWYRFMQQMCHNEFKWNEFEQLLNNYTGNEKAVELFNELKEAYSVSSTGPVLVATNEVEDAFGRTLPHLYVRLGKELETENAEMPATWMTSSSAFAGWEEYTGPVMEPNEFIKMVAEYAMEQYHTRSEWVLPSVCIAQACLETGYGKSKRMMNSHAIFGIKATSAWVDKAKYGGLVYNSKTKECYDGSTYTNISATFRAYNSFSDSISDYYDLICGASRYSGAVNNSDPKSAITAIKNGGYATLPTYVNSISKIIQMYNLTQYDK